MPDPWFLWVGNLPVMHSCPETQEQDCDAISMPGPPVLTVLIPAFNPGFEWLLASVKSVTSQTFESLEIIVVDDGGSDGSVDAVRSELDDPRIKWIKQKNMGKSATINRVIERARGKYFAVQDADDLSDPSRFEMQVARLESDSVVAGVFCGYDLIIKGRRMAPSTRGMTKAECEDSIRNFAMPSHDPTGCYRRDLVAQFPYAEDLRIGQGIDFILRLGEQHALERIPGCYYSYRIHSNSITKTDPSQVMNSRREAIRRAHDRRDIRFKPSSPMSRLRFDNEVFRIFVVSVKEHLDRKERWKALRIAWDSICVSPLDRCYYLPLFHIILPTPLKEWLRKKR